MAAGLAQGTTSDGELMDVFLYERMPASEALGPRARAPPAGLRALDAREVGLGLPSLACGHALGRLRGDGRAGRPMKRRCRGRDRTVPRIGRRCRGRTPAARRSAATTSARSSTMCDATFCGEASTSRCGSAATRPASGGPTQVVKALGLPEPSRVHRTRIVLDEPSPAREAWRRRGRFVALACASSSCGTAKPNITRAASRSAGADVPLNERGFEQAQALASLAQRIAHPRRRTADQRHLCQPARAGRRDRPAARGRAVARHNR